MAPYGKCNRFCLLSVHIWERKITQKNVMWFLFYGELQFPGDLDAHCSPFFCISKLLFFWENECGSPAGLATLSFMGSVFPRKERGKGTVRLKQRFG